MLDQRVDAAPVKDPTRQMRPSNASEPSSSIPLLGDRSTIGKSLLIKGEITGSESLHIEGKVEGIIDLPGDCVTVGRDGRVSAGGTVGHRRTGGRGGMHSAGDRQKGVPGQRGHV